MNRDSLAMDAPFGDSYSWPLSVTGNDKRATSLRILTAPSARKKPRIPISITLEA